MVLWQWEGCWVCKNAVLVLYQLCQPALCEQSEVWWSIGNVIQQLSWHAVGDDGGGHWLVRMEWRPARWSVCLPLLIFPCIMKSRSSLLPPAHPGGPGKRAIKWLNVCVCQLVRSSMDGHPKNEPLQFIVHRCQLWWMGWHIPGDISTGISPLIFNLCQVAISVLMIIILISTSVFFVDDDENENFRRRK